MYKCKVGTMYVYMLSLGTYQRVPQHCIQLLQLALNMLKDKGTCIRKEAVVWRIF